MHSSSYSSISTLFMFATVSSLSCFFSVSFVLVLFFFLSRAFSLLPQRNGIYRFTYYYYNNPSYIISAFLKCRRDLNSSEVYTGESCQFLSSCWITILHHVQQKDSKTENDLPGLMPERLVNDLPAFCSSIFNLLEEKISVDLFFYYYRERTGWTA